MLQVQVQYWTLKEATRHNKETERQGAINLAETARHNVTTENETYRHNVVTETETQRHNLATEEYYNNVLNETTRHNIQEEQIGFQNAQTNERNAETNAFNAETNRINAGTQKYMAETGRFSAVTGYSLGLDANRIAQQNADTNERNSQNQWLQWTTAESNKDVNAMNAATNQLNAATNQTNAETRQGELQLGNDNLNFQQRKWQEENIRKWYDSMTGAGLKAADVFTNALGQYVSP